MKKTNKHFSEYFLKTNGQTIIESICNLILISTTNRGKKKKNTKCDELQKRTQNFRTFCIQSWRRIFFSLIRLRADEVLENGDENKDEKQV